MFAGGRLRLGEDGLGCHACCCATCQVVQAAAVEHFHDAAWLAQVLLSVARILLLGWEQAPSCTAHRCNTNAFVCYTTVVQPLQPGIAFKVSYNVQCCVHIDTHCDMTGDALWLRYTGMKQTRAMCEVVSVRQTPAMAPREDIHLVCS